MGVKQLIPSDLKYTKEHEWVKIEKNRVVMGITNYAQQELGDVVYIDLPGVGEKVKQNTLLTTIESVKAVSDIFAPVSGEVVEVNEELQHSPELINQDPYGKGWIAIIEIDDPEELKNLLTPDAYQKHIGE